MKLNQALKLKHKEIVELILKDPSIDIMGIFYEYVIVAFSTKYNKNVLLVHSRIYPYLDLFFNHPKFQNTEMTDDLRTRVEIAERT